MRYGLSCAALAAAAVLGVLAVPVCLWTGLPMGPWGNSTEPATGTRWERFVYLVWRNPASNFGHWLGVKQMDVKLRAEGVFPSDYYGIYGEYSAQSTDGRYFEEYSLKPSLFTHYARERRRGWKFIPPEELAKKPDYVAPLVWRPFWLRRMR